MNTTFTSRMAGTALAVLLGATPAFAAAPAWVNGGGTGFKWLRIEDQGFSLFVQCADVPSDNVAVKLWKRLRGTTEHSSVGFARRRDESWYQPLPKFQLTVHGRAYDGPIDTSTQAGATQFQAVVAALRVAPATVVADGVRVSMPSTLAAQTLPDAASLAGVCKLD